MLPFGITLQTIVAICESPGCINMGKVINHHYVEQTIVEPFLVDFDGDGTDRCTACGQPGVAAESDLATDTFSLYIPENNTVSHLAEFFGKIVALNESHSDNSVIGVMNISREEDSLVTINILAYQDQIDAWLRADGSFMSLRQFTQTLREYPLQDAKAVLWHAQGEREAIAQVRREGDGGIYLIDLFDDRYINPDFITYSIDITPGIEISAP